jgi:hypothetical protein
MRTAALSDLGEFAARTAAEAAGSAALALSLILIPSNIGGAPVTGAVPGRPDLSYSWTPDEGTLVLSREVDGQEVPFQTAEAGAGGVYFDAAGDPVAQILNGHLVLDPNAIGSLALSVGETRAKPPPGSKPISETPWSGDHGEIKGALELGGEGKVNIAPDGDMWVQNPDGTWTNEGPATDYTGSGKPSGRRGKDRDR